MKESITQEFDYGCGVACFAFILGISYKEATVILGKDQSTSNRFWVKDFIFALNDSGKPYYAKHIKPRIVKSIYNEGVIVLIRRSKRYPSGHYLVRYKDVWMDPWINLPTCKDIYFAKSGYRKRLPGKPMYALFPI
jgi:hypothetical protein